MLSITPKFLFYFFVDYGAEKEKGSASKQPAHDQGKTIVGLGEINQTLTAY